MRIGQGFDVHQSVEGRRLILGGVAVPYDRGLLGHSDADVLVHAIMDALLGAIGAGDIGGHFPDDDPRFKDADSLKLLEHVLELVKAAGWAVVNLDATIIAQRPKLAGYIPAMRENLSKAVNISFEQVNVKATTTEGLGFTGRGEGIAAMAVVLLEQIRHEAEGG
jgi:2-C-methyl-D-erythritol 2,4-cyclodiphosphate synthase